MPFITQCPHVECGKYMLMEEDARGTTVDCLVCKKPIELEPIILDVPKDDLPPSVSAKDRFAVRNCPKCKRPIRVLPEQFDKAMNCPECDFWGIVR